MSTSSYSRTQLWHYFCVCRAAHSPGYVRACPRVAGGTVEMLGCLWQRFLLYAKDRRHRKCSSILTRAVANKNQCRKFAVMRDQSRVRLLASPRSVRTSYYVDKYTALDSAATFPHRVYCTSCVCQSWARPSYLEQLGIVVNIAHDCRFRTEEAMIYHGSRCAHALMHLLLSCSVRSPWPIRMDLDVRTR